MIPFLTIGLIECCLLLIVLPTACLLSRLRWYRREEKGRAALLECVCQEACDDFKKGIRSRSAHQLQLKRKS